MSNIDKQALRIKRGEMCNFHERKVRRTEYYQRFVFGWKLRPCTACNGSGYYDHNGSPKCSSCNGTGKERYKPN